MTPGDFYQIQSYSVILLHNSIKARPDKIRINKVNFKYNRLSV